jgi:hypothetical protein
MVASGLSNILMTKWLHSLQWLHWLQWLRWLQWLHSTIDFAMTVSPRAGAGARNSAAELPLLQEPPLLRGGVVVGDS